MAEEAADLKAAMSLQEALAIAQEKGLPIIMNVAGGPKYRGRVKDVSAHAVIVYKMAGNEQYDFYVPLNQIASVDFEVRVSR